MEQRRNAIFTPSCGEVSARPAIELSELKLGGSNDSLEMLWISGSGGVTFELVGRGFRPLPGALTGRLRRRLLCVRFLNRSGEREYMNANTYMSIYVRVYEWVLFCSTISWHWWGPIYTHSACGAVPSDIRSRRSNQKWCFWYGSNQLYTTHGLPHYNEPPLHQEVDHDTVYA